MFEKLKERIARNREEKKTKHIIKVVAPVNGKVIDITAVDDDVFNQKMLGDGIAIVPTSGEFHAPFDGTITSVFETKHAYWIQHQSQVDCLIHIGLDTVNLKGKGFTSKVKAGQKVKAGDLIAVVDWNLIASEVRSQQTPIVFTANTLEGKNLIKLNLNKNVKVGDEIISIE